MEIDGLDPDKPTATDGVTPHAGRWVVFWHFLKNYWSTSHQSKFSGKLREGGLSGECINNNHHSSFFFKSGTWKASFSMFLSLYRLWTLSLSVFFPSQCVLKIITCNEDEVRGEERDRHTQDSKFEKKQHFFEVNEVKIQKTSPMWFWNWPFASLTAKAK